MQQAARPQAAQAAVPTAAAFVGRPTVAPACGPRLRPAGRRPARGVVRGRQLVRMTAASSASADVQQAPPQQQVWERRGWVRVVQFSWQLSPQPTILSASPNPVTQLYLLKPRRPPARRPLRRNTRLPWRCCL